MAKWAVNGRYGVREENQAVQLFAFCLSVFHFGFLAPWFTVLSSIAAVMVVQCGSEALPRTFKCSSAMDRSNPLSSGLAVDPSSLSLPLREKNFGGQSVPSAPASLDTARISPFVTPRVASADKQIGA